MGPATKDLVMELRRQFDYVIFDCPPLTAIDDTFSIAAYLDGLFFVVRAGKTSMRFAKMGLNTIHQRGAPILGLIVNGVSIDDPYYYYTTYYYASYYHRPLSPDENILPPNAAASSPRASRALPDANFHRRIASSPLPPTIPARKARSHDRAFRFPSPPRKPSVRNWSGWVPTANAGTVGRHTAGPLCGHP